MQTKPTSTISLVKMGVKLISNLVENVLLWSRGLTLTLVELFLDVFVLKL